MGRIVLTLMAACLWAGAALAQGFTGLARLEAADIRDGWGGSSELTLDLSQGVPFRVFILGGPPRLVIDFSEVSFDGVSPSDVLARPGNLRAVRFGAFRPGWSRLVADLSGPMLPEDVAMSVDEASGKARLTLRLERADSDAFAAASGTPEGSDWLPEQVSIPPQDFDLDRFSVVLDPGHGGIDPGAEREGLVEKDLVLDVALQLRDQLRRAGVDVVMTRERDVFVSLEGRTAIGHQAKGSLFMSLHADALSQGGASGATVYTLSERASDEASALLAARHNRSDILAGVDLSGADDEVTSVLLDLARQETEPRSAALAGEVIDAMAEAGGPMNRKPWRKAGFSVLKSADIPSVLVELGFLSDARDRRNLANPEWRAGMTAALARGILAWRDADAARAELLRQ